jgi:hypothetical protein
MPTITAYPGKVGADRLVAVRGDTTTINLAFLQSAGGSAQDLTAATLAWSAKCHPEDDTTIFSGVGGAGITVSSAVAGLAYITVAASDWTTWDSYEPSVMSWDLQTTIAGVISTVAHGTITVRYDTTR